MNRHAVFNAFALLTFSNEKQVDSANIINQALTNDTLDASFFRLLPMLYKNADHQLFPPENWAKIKGTYRHTFYRNRLLIERMKQIQHQLHATDIFPVLMLKGIALTLHYYEDLGSRPMGDIDIFTPSLPLKKNVLHAFNKKYQYKLKHDSTTAITLADRQEFQYDLHRKVHSFALSSYITQLALNYATKLKRDNINITVLCPEHQFVHMTYHGLICPTTAYAKRWIFDVIKIMRSFKLDAKKAAAFSNALNAPLIIKNALDELRRLPKEIDIDHSFINALYPLIAHKNDWLEKLILPKPSPENSTSLTKPSLKTYWMQVVSAYLWQHETNFRTYLEIKYDLKKEFSMIKFMIKKLLRILLNLSTKKYH